MTSYMRRIFAYIKESLMTLKRERERALYSYRNPLCQSSQHSLLTISLLKSFDTCTTLHTHTHTNVHVYVKNHVYASPQTHSYGKTWALVLVLVEDKTKELGCF